MIFAVHRIIAVLVVLIIGVVAYTLRKKKSDFHFMRRILALALFVFALVISILHEEAIALVIGKNHGPSPFGDAIPQTIFATLLVWFTNTAILITVVAQFAKNTILLYAERFFALPVFILDLAFFDTFAIANVGPSPDNSGMIYLLFITMLLTLAASLCLFESILNIAHLPGKRNSLITLGAAASAVLVTMPSYVPQVLVGYHITSGIKLSNFTFAHRIAIYIAIIIPIIAFHILKNRCENTKRLCMTFFALASLWSHLSYYCTSDWTSLANLPLGIISMAIILMPFALMAKSTSIFNCCLFLGVLNAFTNMLFPNIAEINMATTESVRFWLSQYFVFSAPLLCISLKLFDRPRIAGLLRAMSAFTVYFFVTLYLDAVIGNYVTSPDYLNFSTNYLLSAFPGFTELVKEIGFKIHLGKIIFDVHPIYDFIVFLSYEVLMVIMWFAYKVLFKTWDKAENRRMRERDYNQMKKDLKEFLGDKPIDAPMYGDNSPKLVLRQFSKKYGTNKHYSVDHVSFNVKGGEIFGFLGPNGAGKSTIIKSIVGIQTITSGSIEICGYDVERQPIQAKLNTGFVPDHYALYENLTGREYINYIADLYGVDKETRDETIEKYVTRFQLTHSFDNQMKTYSHGMKQKIAIMAALVHNPKVWILDEPLTGLDPNSIYEVKECMKEHAAKGNIVFFSSHIIDVVEKICDKIAIIKKGRIRAAATVSELDAKGIDLEELYLYVITSDDDMDVINVGGDEILNLNPEEISSTAGATAV